MHHHGGDHNKVAGRDYHLTEESVTLCILEDIRALEEVSTMYALHAHCFAMIFQILDRAVSDGVDFGKVRRCTKLVDRVAKTIDIGRGGGGAGARCGANPGRVGRPPCTSNHLNFGLDGAIGVPKTIDLDCEGCGASAGSGANLGSVGRQESKKRLQKNCFECTRAHRLCVFELMNNNLMSVVIVFTATP